MITKLLRQKRLRRKASRKMPPKAKPFRPTPPPTAADERRWAILGRLDASNYGATVGEQVDNLRGTGDPYLVHLADQIDGLVQVCSTGDTRAVNAYIDGLAA